jgi:hypothetical protein
LTGSQVRKMKEVRAQVTSETYLMEVAVGTVAGAGLGFCSMIVIGGEDGGLGTAILGAAAGYTIGAALGVYAVGTAGDYTGSFASTLTGSVVGALISAWVFGSNNELAQTLEWGSLIFPPAGGSIGFNLSRSYRGAGGQSYYLIQGGPLCCQRYNRRGTHYVNLIDLDF